MHPSKPNRLPLRTGLFGGTFNPIHIGHQRVAQDVLTQFGLDRIYFVPSAQPPHKMDEPPVDGRDRLEMVRLALEGLPGLEASAVEIRRGGTSYSLDTVLEFTAHLPEGGRLFFMVGVDAFLEIHTWKKYERLFDHTSFIVMSRPPEPTIPSAGFQEVAAYIRHEVSKGYAIAADRRVLVHPAKQPIYFAEVTPVDISARRLRRMLQRHQPVDAWLSPAVADFIQQKGLYR